VCPAGYVAAAPAFIDLLEHFTGSAASRLNGDVNHWECTMTGCKVWNLGLDAVVKTRCIKTAASNVVDGNLLATTINGWSAYSTCPHGFVALSLVHMDLLDHTTVAGTQYDMNHWECTKTGCRAWIQNAKANIRTRCIRGTAATIVDAPRIRGGRNYWSGYSTCPSGSYAMGMGYMDLLGGKGNTNLNHRECTSTSCRVWGTTTTNSDIIIGTRCLYMNRIGYTNAPTRHPTISPTRQPTRAPTVAPTKSAIKAWWTPYRGGNGGRGYTKICPTGSTIDYWQIRTGSLVDNIRGRCSNGLWLGGCGGGGGHFWQGRTPSTRSAYVRTGALVDQIWGRGGNGGGGYTLSCDNGKISGYHARCGSLVDGLKFYCTASAAPDFSIRQLGGVASQSSEGWAGRPSRAIDGNTNQGYGAGTCTHTSTAGHPWWKLTLPKTYMINKVQVWNRVDCCRERLHGVRVSVAGRQCGTLSSSTAVQTVNCHNQKSNYVLIQQYRSNYLTLCEVKVYGAENSGCDAMLKFASAAQVGHMHGHSTAHYGAHRAIDGSTGTRQGVASGKWTGDLGSVQDLTELTIQWEACQCANKGSILIDVSADNRHWSRFATEGGWHQWGGRVTRTVRGHAKARYVRITGVTSLMRNSWFSMWEVTAKGCSNAATFKASVRPAALQSGWVAYGHGYEAPSTTRYGDLCVVSGLIRRHGMSNPLMTLPTDCRPNKRVIFNLNNHQNTLRVDVLTNGQVHYVSGTWHHGWLNLDGIQFAVANQKALATHSGWVGYGHGYGSPTYTKTNVVCEVEGLVRGGHWGHNMVVLPTNCRPKKRLIFNMNNHAKPARVDVQTNGAVTWHAGGRDHHWISLGGIMFSTNAGVAIPLQNGWTDYGHGYGPITVEKTGGLCLASGLLRGSAWGHSMAQLPSDCRPKGRLIFNMNNHGKTARVDVTTDGKIYWIAGGRDHSWISITGVNIHRNA
jgi:hypothetical protein